MAARRESAAKTGLCSGGIVLMLCLCLRGTAQAQKPVSPSQRTINEYASVLLISSRRLLEEPHIRLPNESLPAYLRRLTAAQPNENAMQRHQRITDYIALLNRAAERTARLRKIPALSDTSADNQRVWKKTADALNLLPRRVAHLQTAWTNNVPAIDAEFTQTIYVLLAAQDGLRDARP